MEKLITEVQNIQNITLVTLKGNLTAEADERLFSLINSTLAAGLRNIVLDLARVTYINSAGFGILIALIDEVKAREGSVKFAALSPHFKKTAKLIGLHRFADFYRTVEDAISSINQGDGSY